MTSNGGRVGFFGPATAIHLGVMVLARVVLMGVMTVGGVLRPDRCRHLIITFIGDLPVSIFPIRVTDHRPLAQGILFHASIYRTFIFPFLLPPPATTRADVVTAGSHYGGE